MATDVDIDPKNAHLEISINGPIDASSINALYNSFNKFVLDDLIRYDIVELAINSPGGSFQEPEPFTEKLKAIWHDCSTSGRIFTLKTRATGQCKGTAALLHYLGTPGYRQVAVGCELNYLISDLTAYAQKIDFLLLDVLKQRHSDIAPTIHEMLLKEYQELNNRMTQHEKKGRSIGFDLGTQSTDNLNSNPDLPRHPIEIRGLTTLKP